MYENTETLKLNEVVEFIGIISNDPAMVNFPDQKRYLQSIVPFQRKLQTELATKFDQVMPVTPLQSDNFVSLNLNCLLRFN